MSLYHIVLRTYVSLISRRLIDDNRATRTTAASAYSILSYPRVIIHANSLWRSLRPGSETGGDDLRSARHLEPKCGKTV